MQIVLPGALPEPAQARELAAHLAKAAPTLHRWLKQGRARLASAPAAETGCTALEQWQLAQRGFTPHENQNLSAGLGPLLGHRADIPADTPIWLAELVHVAPSRDGAALLRAGELQITEPQSHALFDSAGQWFQDTPFTLHAHSATHWRIGLPADTGFRCASPALVAATAVNDWWPQEAQARPWRRLFNELQMSWFDHPVNHARAAQGLAPINGLWLFGGASVRQLPASPAPDLHQYDALQAPALRQDWHAWLAAWAELEAQVFSRQPSAPARLVLTGHDRVAEISQTRAWQRWLPGQPDAWSTCWQARN